MIFSPAIVLNHHNGEEFLLITASDLDTSESVLKKIVAICNEELIYRVLFKSMCEGKPYSLHDAESFITWAKEGFKEKTHFVFFILDSDKLPVGAIDIKSNNLISAEIGYWLSDKYSGIMTNALIELGKQAKKNGFEKLYGLCVPTNKKSQKVLERALYTNVGNTTERGKGYIKFEKILNLL